MHVSRTSPIPPRTPHVWGPHYRSTTSRTAYTHTNTHICIGRYGPCNAFSSTILISSSAWRMVRSERGRAPLLVAVAPSTHRALSLCVSLWKFGFSPGLLSVVHTCIGSPFRPPPSTLMRTSWVQEQSARMKDGVMTRAITCCLLRCRGGRRTRSPTYEHA